MNTVAAFRTGAPSVPVRAVALVLAALATGIPLLLLLFGLSIRTFETMRQSPTFVALIPLPEPPPPEPDSAPVPHEARRAAAPAPAPPRPAALIDQSPVIRAEPRPAAADVSGPDTGVGAAGGSGSGGSGTGGAGTDSGGSPVASVRTGASWISKPGTPELLPFNPPLARRKYVTGHVLLGCRVLRSGSVADCRVMAERPRGYGFGGAALQASRIFRLNPPTIDGEPDEAQQVEIPVSFYNRR